MQAAGTPNGNVSLGSFSPALIPNAHSLGQSPDPGIQKPPGTIVHNGVSGRPPVPRGATPSLEKPGSVQPNTALSAAQLPLVGPRPPFQLPNMMNRPLLPGVTPPFQRPGSPFGAQSSVTPRVSTPTLQSLPRPPTLLSSSALSLSSSPAVSSPSQWPVQGFQPRPGFVHPPSSSPGNYPIMPPRPTTPGANQPPSSFAPQLPGIQRLPTTPLMNNQPTQNGVSYPESSSVYNGGPAANQGNYSQMASQTPGVFQPLNKVSYNQMTSPLVGSQPPSQGNYNLMASQPPGGFRPPSYNQMASPAGGSQPSNQGNYNQMASQPPGGFQLPIQAQMGGVPRPQVNPASLNAQFGQMSVTGAGFNKLWGNESVDLLANRTVLPPEGITPPAIKLQNEYLNRVNCSSEIVRCTLTKFPESKSLLEKARLPLGILIHPFKDLQQLPVITCQNITRCRTCRTYVNPFVYFVDQRRWKCNLCFRVNELPDDFLVEPSTKQYGDPSKRPEVLNATIEYIAPAEYMLRAPPPATYIYVLEATVSSLESGYLKLFCDIFLEELERIPGDTRAQFAFITFGASIHFHSLEEGTKQPRMIVVNDINDVFLPTCEGLLAKRNSCQELIESLLEILPSMVEDEARTEGGGNCLGAALQAASKLAWSTGGRISAFVATLPNMGPGALKPRGDQNAKGSKDVGLLAPAVDFYKSMALENNSQHIAVDLFFLGSKYQDVASISCVSRYSSGCMYRFPSFHAIANPLETQRFESLFRRYLTRKIGFESVMRVRCTRGLSIHTFHGNLFVRSTDLLALANINPDAGFGMQVSIEEPLTDMTSVCFQAAVLYTSSKGERRIRVHTVCFPLASTVADIVAGADQQAIVGLLSKIAVDRSLTSSITDAREAFVNAASDPLSAYKALQALGSGQLLAPPNLKLLPMYILSMLKSIAFRDIPTGLDDRVFDMCEMKSLPLPMLIQHIYPDLYAVHLMEDEDPPRIHLSSEKVDTTGVYVMDAGLYIFILVGRTSPLSYCKAVFDVDSPRQVETSYELQLYDTVESKRLHAFVESLQSEKPCPAAIQIFRDDAHQRVNFFNRLVEDKNELGLGYFEFLQQLKSRVK